MAARKDVQAALDQHAETLRRHKDVVGLGVTQLADGSGDAIAVYVRCKRPPAKPGADDSIPRKVQLTRAEERIDIPVEVVDLGGELTAQ